MSVFVYVNEENYFEVLESLYAWLSMNHEGQTSDKYEKLSTLGNLFTPGPLWSESRTEKENEFFTEISEENFEEIFEEIYLYLTKDDYII